MKHLIALFLLATVTAHSADTDTKTLRVFIFAGSAKAVPSVPTFEAWHGGN